MVNLVLVCARLVVEDLQEIFHVSLVHQYWPPITIVSVHGVLKGHLGLVRIWTHVTTHPTGRITNVQVVVLSRICWPVTGLMLVYFRFWFIASLVLRVVHSSISADIALIICFLNTSIYNWTYNRINFRSSHLTTTGVYLTLSALIIQLNRIDLISQLTDNHISLLHFHLHFLFHVPVLFLLLFQYSIQLHNCILVAHVSHLQILQLHFKFLCLSSQSVVVPIGPYLDLPWNYLGGSLHLA
jgi:hypothetical protein